MILIRGVVGFFFFTFVAQAGVPVDEALTSLKVETIREAFLKEHRVFEKIIEQRAEWESPFCQGQGTYQYQLRLKTQIQELDIQVEEDGSISIKAVLERPSFALRGSYQGAYSFCYPVGNGTEMEADKVALETRVYFGEGDLEAGQLDLKVEVISLEFGTLRTKTFSSEYDEVLTRLLNQGLDNLWKSHLGEWFNQTISFFLNQNFPIRT